MDKQKELEKDFKETLNGVSIKSKTYNNGAIVTISAGKIESDGDSGHGGRTYLKMEDMSCIDVMLCVTDENGIKHYFGKNEWGSLEILAGGELERKILSDIFSASGKYFKDGEKEF